MDLPQQITNFFRLNLGVCAAIKAARDNTEYFCVRPVGVSTSSCCIQTENKPHQTTVTLKWQLQFSYMH